VFKGPKSGLNTLLTSNFGATRGGKVCMGCYATVFDSEKDDDDC
jgi:hypothetical protein